jgi:hypothetical protein
MGKSGSGKTTYIKARIAQQIKRGGGLTCVDAKLDYEFLEWLNSTCATYNRKFDLRVINIDSPETSHTYSPLLSGDAEAVTSRFANVVQTGSDASAEHFKGMAVQALTPTIACIKEMNMAYNALDLFILLTNPTAMNWLLTNTPEGEARRNFALHLDSYRSYDPRTQSREINTARIQQQIGGLASRIYSYGTGNLGKIMNGYSPELNLLDAIDNNLITYIMLPTMEKKESSAAFAKLYLSDLVSTVAAMYKRPSSTLPIIPHEIFGDEFGSWAIDHIEEGFEKFRGARISLNVSFQTAANLLKLGEDFADKVIGNCDTRNFMQLGDPRSCEVAAKIVGQMIKKFRSESSGVSVGEGNKNLDFQLFHNISQSESSSEGYSERYDYIVRPEEFMALDVGEAFCIPLAAKQCFKLKIPVFDPRVREPFKITRFETPARVGLNMAERFDLEFASPEMA